MALLTSGNPINGTSSSDLILSQSNGSAIGGDGNDVILGDIGAILAVPPAAGTDQPSAIDLDGQSAIWSTDENPLFGDSNIPHATIYAAPAAGTQNYYALSLSTGQTITVDIDYAWTTVGSATSVDTIVTLIGPGGTVASNADDTGTPPQGGYGSPGVSTRDSYLTFTVTNPGTYYILVSKSGPGLSPINFVGGEEFLIQVSVTGHAVQNSTPGDDTLEGGAGTDELFGGGGNDLLIGGSESDILHGGSGIDTASYAGATGSINLDLRLTTPQNLGSILSFDTLIEIENLIGGTIGDQLTGTDGANQLEGREGNDTLTGLDGDDTLDGGIGNDSMIGGLGNDVFYVDSAGDVVVENAGEGFDEVRTTLSSAAIATFANIEALTYVGTGNASLSGGPGPNLLTGGIGNDTISGFGDADTLVGGAGNDRLIGNAGDDSIDGGNGSDAMFGGGGNDTYLIDSAGDRAIEFAGQGFDTVLTTLASTNMWSFNDQVEALTFVGTGDATLLGALAGNAITGGAGNDSLRGFGGDDTIAGGDGADTLTGDNGDDVLNGGLGNDLIFGGAGADTIAGGAGRDFMTGKGGADVFAFADGDFSGAGTTNSDRIEDFVQGTDLIDLSAVDAVTGGGDDAFAFIGTTAFHGVAGELRYDQTPTSTMIYGDTDGDGTADFAFKLAGLIALTAGDFVL